MPLVISFFGYQIHSFPRFSQPSQVGKILKSWRKKKFFQNFWRTSSPLIRGEYAHFVGGNLNMDKPHFFLYFFWHLIFIFMKSKIRDFNKIEFWLSGGGRGAFWPNVLYKYMCSQYFFPWTSKNFPWEFSQKCTWIFWMCPWTFGNEFAREP